MSSLVSVCVCLCVCVCEVDIINYKAKEKLNKQGIKVGIVNLLWLKPLKIEEKWIKFLKK